MAFSIESATKNAKPNVSGKHYVSEADFEKYVNAVQKAYGVRNVKTNPGRPFPDGNVAFVVSVPAESRNDDMPLNKEGKVRAQIGEFVKNADGDTVRAFIFTAWLPKEAAKYDAYRWKAAKDAKNETTEESEPETFAIPAKKGRTTKKADPAPAPAKNSIAAKRARSRRPA